MTDEPDQPTAPNTRTFSLNSPEAYEALRDQGERPWIPNGALPREPRWPRRPSGMWVTGANEAEADQAFREWMRHVEAERVGG